MKKIICATAVMMSLSLLTLGVAWSEPPTGVGSLESRVQALETVVAQLQTRIATLESELATDNTNFSQVQSLSNEALFRQTTNAELMSDTSGDLHRIAALQ